MRQDEPVALKIFEKRQKRRYGSKTCYVCGKKGHIAKDCYQTKRTSFKSKENDNKVALAKTNEMSDG